MANLTFEQLPNAVNTLYEKFEKLLNCLSSLHNIVHTDSEEIFSVAEAAAFLEIAKQTLYAKGASNSIPCYKPYNRLYFFKNELVAFIKGAKVHTILERRGNVEAFFRESEA